MKVNGELWTVDIARRSRTRDPRDAGPRPLSTVNRPLAVMVVLMLVTVIAPIANACPVCFGDPNSPLVKGTSNGVMFLLGIVGFVQLGFVALFYSFWRRAQSLKKFRDQFYVVKGGAIELPRS